MRNPIFAAMGAEACRQLASTHPSRRLAGNTTIARPGDAAVLHVLLRGTARVFQRAPDGRRFLLRLLRAPVVMGDTELLRELAFLESVEAIEEVELSTIPARDYAELLGRHPAAALEQMRHLAAVGCLTALVQQHLVASLEQRVANVLLSYVDLFGEERAAEPLVRCPLSARDVAQSIVAVQSSVAKLMASWSKARIVVKQRNRFLIRAPRALEQLAAPSRGGLFYQMGEPRAYRPAGPAGPAGSRMSAATVEVVEGQEPDLGRSLLVGDELRIGREPFCQLILSDSNVSRLHCRIFRAATGARYWVEDLGSSNGTVVNNRSVRRRAVLRDGDTLQLGATCLRFALVPGDEGSSR